MVTSGPRTYAEGPISWSADSKWLLARGNTNGTLDLIEVATGIAVPLPFAAAYRNASLK